MATYQPYPCKKTGNTTMRKLLYAVICLLPLIASAEPPKKILIVNSNSNVEKYLFAQQAFQEHFDGQTQVLDLGNAALTFNMVRAAFYDIYPDYIYAIGAKAYLAANKFVGEKTIIFSSTVNWHRLPEIEKRYGISNELHGGMQLVLIKRLFPDIKHIAVLYSEKYTSQMIDEFVAAAKLTDQVIHPVAAELEMDLVHQLKTQKNIQAVLLLSDPIIINNKSSVRQIMEYTDRHALPTLGYFSSLFAMGAIMVISVDEPTIGRQAAQLMKNVIAKPRQAPSVDYPAGSEISVDIRRVKSLGVTYNKDALIEVTHIIE